MTQDRRKDDKLPEGPLVFTDRNLTAAGLAHLEAERAAACLVHAGGDVWVGVGTKGALRGLLSDDTASQSQAVPSELASARDIWTLLCEHGEYTRSGNYTVIYEHHIKGIHDRIQSLFSHSAATGKVPEGWKLVPVQVSKEMRDAANLVWVTTPGCDIEAIYAAMLAASPAAPLAGKAEPVAWVTFGTFDGKKNFERGFIATNPRYCETHKEFKWEPLYTAPLAAAVPAEEASDAIYVGNSSDVVVNLREFASNAGYSHNDYQDTMRQAANVIEHLRAQFWHMLPGYVPSPAEPAPILASALTDERITELNREAQDQAISGIGPSIYLARAIEREVLARLSTPTAEGEKK